MARIARKNLDAMYYHVMVQGINKEYIFEKDECKKIYIKLLWYFISCILYYGKSCASFIKN